MGHTRVAGVQHAPIIQPPPLTQEAEARESLYQTEYVQVSERARHYSAKEHKARATSPEITDAQETFLIASFTILMVAIIYAGFVVSFYIND